MPLVPVTKIFMDCLFQQCGFLAHRMENDTKEGIDRSLKKVHNSQIKTICSPVASKHGYRRFHQSQGHLIQGFGGYSFASLQDVMHRWTSDGEPSLIDELLKKYLLSHPV